MQTPPLKGTVKGDVYSFAICVQEVLARDKPFYQEDLAPNGRFCARCARLQFTSRTFF